ncbi:hypothetical protein OC498_15305, partial [Acinetobacter bohemicus]|uniref:hypothetical protein n=1 Tax=Acinetobacter bohemicus TaxID=1435036 RepID=UPI0021D3FEE7
MADSLSVLSGQSDVEVKFKASLPRPESKIAILLPSTFILETVTSRLLHQYDGTPKALIDFNSIFLGQFVLQQLSRTIFSFGS